MSTKNPPRQNGSDKRIVHRAGEDPADWSLHVRDGELEASRAVPFDGVLRFTTEEREFQSSRKNFRFGLDVERVVMNYLARVDAGVSVSMLVEEAGRALRDGGVDA